MSTTLLLSVRHKWAGVENFAEPGSTQAANDIGLVSKET